ncbi:MAG TPA: ArnT family glycosyltransferase [Candidatus Hypogeohydataceae bacterium YC41]
MERFLEDERVLVGSLVLLCFLLYILNLGNASLSGKHEALYAGVAREMFVDGNWTIPHFDGQIYTEKPPLYFWMVALCSLPIGDVNEFTARLPAALCAMGTVIVTFFLGRKLFNTRAAFLGALILATCVLFVVSGRRVRLDTAFTFFISSSLLAFYSGYISNKKTYYFLLFWFLVALAVLTKGLFALFLVICPIALYLFLSGDLKVLVETRFLFGFSAFILTIAAWLLLAYEQDGGDYIKQFVFVNSGLSYIIPLTEAKHHHSLLRYTIGYFFLGMLPWSIFLLVFFYRFFSKGLWKQNRQLLFPGVWFFGMLFIFILMGQKRATYYLPIYPPAALLIATWWDDSIGASPNVQSPWLLKGLECFTVVILGAATVWACQGVSSREIILCAFTVLLILGLGYFFVYSRRFKELFIFIFLIAVSTGVSYNQIFVPREKKSVLRQGFYKELNSILGTCTTLALYGHGLDYKEILFYSKKRLKIINSVDELEEFFRSGVQVYCLMTQKNYSQLSSTVDMHLVKELPAEKLLLVSNK